MQSTESIGRQIASGIDSLKQKSLVAELFSGQKQGLGLIENRIAENLGSDAELLTEISSYLLEMGGKRVRPLLALLTYKMFGAGKPTEQLIEAASGIELIHMATLLHDDIIDKSMVRRNSESAFSRFGLIPTLLSGDFLLVKAFGMCARLDRFVIDRTEKACIELTEGELLEGYLSLEREVPLEEYRVIIEKKTASLFSLACVIGAHFADASSHDIEAAGKFGNEAGVLFQMVDDVLDVTADKDLLGKPAGIDLVQKTPTLPNILWLASGDQEAIDYFNQESTSQAGADEAIKKIRRSPALTQSLDKIEETKEKALGYLHSIESEKLDRNIVSQLEGLLNYCLLYTSPSPRDATLSRMPSSA